MGWPQFIARQLRQPAGWVGSHVFAPLMNSGNRRIIESTIALLQIAPHHQVLEIGFGGGAGLALLAKRVQTGVILGLDLSPDMVAHAERRFQTEIAAGRMAVQLGNICSLPYADENFDRAFTINTIYFWPDTQQGLAELRRVLKPDGRAAVAIRSKEKMTRVKFARHGFRLFSADELAEAMRQAGFRNLKVEHSDQDRLYDQVIAVASR